MTQAQPSSNLPPIQRFDAGDFKGSPTWFQVQFLSTLNQFTQAIYDIVNQGVDITQNTKDEIYPITNFTAGASATANTFNFTPKKFVGQPSGVIIGQCVLLGQANPTAIGNPVTLDWIFQAGQVQILAIYGLTNTATYNINLRVF